MALDNLDAAELIDNDEDVATNSSQPLTVDEILSDFSEDRNDDASTEVENEEDADGEEFAPFTFPSVTELDEATEVLYRLNLISEDLSFNSLLSKLETKINKRRLQ